MSLLQCLVILGLLVLILVVWFISEREEVLVRQHMLEERRKSLPPNFKLCPGCNGDKTISCSSCSGKGEEWVPDPDTYPAEAHVTPVKLAPCFVCNGSKEVLCDMCKGIGYISE